jgi:hypothetical protein
MSKNKVYHVTYQYYDLCDESEIFTTSTEFEFPEVPTDEDLENLCKMECGDGKTSKYIKGSLSRDN